MDSEAPPFEGYLTVWNRNSVSPEDPSFYELLRLHVHSEADFAGGASLIAADTPLPIDGTLAVPFRSGQYVTVVRRRNTGQNIALTTGEPVEIVTSCYVLEVFDTTFRLRDNEEVANAALAHAGIAEACNVAQPSSHWRDRDGGDPMPGDGVAGD